MNISFIHERICTELFKRTGVRVRARVCVFDRGRGQVTGVIQGALIAHLATLNTYIQAVT